MRAVIVGLAGVVAMTSAEAGGSKGAPNEMIGSWGSSPVQCRSFHRKVDDITIIGKNTFSFCSGSGCGADILSSRRLPRGYSLHMRSAGNPAGWTYRYQMPQPGVLVHLDGQGKGKDVTMVKCSKADVLAGIGLDEVGSEKKGPSDLAFSALYAHAVPDICPYIKRNDRLIARDLEVGLVKLVEFEQKNHFPMTSLPEEIRITEDRILQRAEIAARSDSTEIKNDFCDEALKAFGERGRLLPSRLIDTRKKA